MAQRQFTCSTLKQVWSYLQASRYVPQLQIPKQGSKVLLTLNVTKSKALSYPASFIRTPLNSINQLSSVKHNTFIDLFTNNPNKQLYMPTISINKLKVYEDVASSKSVEDPSINKIKIIDAPVPGKPEKKEAVRMILIRKRKMRKHKLRRLRKRMRFVFAKKKLKRELRKEQIFRTELLSQVEVVDKYDAKAYVENIINTIRYQPKPETRLEYLENRRLLRKKNRYQTTFVRPSFD